MREREVSAWKSSGIQGKRGGKSRNQRFGGRSPQDFPLPPGAGREKPLQAPGFIFQGKKHQNQGDFLGFCGAEGFWGGFFLHKMSFYVQSPKAARSCLRVAFAACGKEGKGGKNREKEGKRGGKGKRRGKEEKGGDVVPLPPPPRARRSCQRIKNLSPCKKNLENFASRREKWSRAPPAPLEPNPNANFQRGGLEKSHPIPGPSSRFAVRNVNLP